jgi:hypothetical protein
MASGSSTTTIQLDTYEHVAGPKDVGGLLEPHGRRLGGEDNVGGGLPSPTTATEVLQRWNHPRSNMFRVFATFWSLLVMGANDAAYGVRPFPSRPKEREIPFTNQRIGFDSFCTDASHNF